MIYKRRVGANRQRYTVWLSGARARATRSLARSRARFRTLSRTPVPSARDTRYNNVIARAQLTSARYAASIG